MKCFILSLLAAFFSVPVAGHHTDGYRINGKIAGLADGTVIYLVHEFKRIDSATVDKGHFTIRGILTEPVFTSLYTGKGDNWRKLADILLDNREVSVAGTGPDFGHIRVSGSDIDAQWKEWFDRDQRLGYQRHRLDRVYQSLQKSDSKPDADLLKKVMDELAADRITLLKSYVSRYHDSPVGAILPTLCTLHGSLGRADFMEMYEVLSPPMKNTKMAKETLELARKAKK